LEAKKIILSSNAVIDLARPRTNTFNFKSDWVENICLNNSDLIYIDGNKYTVNSYEKSKKKFFDWVYSIPNERIISENTFKNLFIYDNNLSLWWLTKISQKQINRTWVASLFYQMGAIEGILDDYKNEILSSKNSWRFNVFCDSTEEFNYVSNYILNYIKNIDSDLSDRCHFNNYGIPSYHSNRKSIFYLSKLCLRATTGFFFRRWQIRKAENRLPKNPDSDFNHLIFTQFTMDWLFSKGENGNIVEETYLGEIYNKLESKKSSVAYIIQFNQFNDLNKWMNIDNKPNYIILKLSNFDFLMVWIKIIKNQIAWCLTYQKLYKSLYHFNSISTLDSKDKERILLARIVLKDFLNLISRDCTYLLYHYELFNKALPENVKSLILRKEFHSRTRAIKAGLVNSKTKVIGVQHCPAYELFYHYSISPLETGLNSNDQKLKADFIQFMPIPDYIWLYGNFTKDTIMKLGGYPGMRLVVTGPTRNDNMVKRFNTLSDQDKINIKKSLKVPLDRKLLFLCTTRTRIHDTISFISNAINMSTTKPFLLIKAHKNADITLVEDALNKDNKLNDCEIVFGKIDELLIIADCVASGVSTVAFESALVNRPYLLISKGIELRNDIIFNESPVIVHSDEVNHAASTIDTMICDKKFIKTYTESRSEFLSKYMYNEDGRALERVYNFTVNL
tara:strand:+ start:2237 stop:4267 length:2031 start_codon:yes stop_codon:yes gene_type:complete